MPPSTHYLDALPPIATLRRLTQSLAMLDAILSPEWQYRYYSHNSKWGAGQEMASMRDGCGDDWFLLFDEFGAALKGYVHKSPLAGNDSFAAQLQQVVPSGFASFLNEPAFKMKDATFCLWRRTTDSRWTAVLPHDPALLRQDGSDGLLQLFDGVAGSYQAWAEAYYEITVSLAAVSEIYRHRPLYPALVASLKPELTLDAVAADAAEIGYPIRG